MSAPITGEPLFNNFKIPPWAGKPAIGLHLDVLKEGKLSHKLMIDEKKCYFFGRNKQLCDFTIDHASCSRVHAALVWHKHLNRPFLIDTGSTHGTFIGRIRLEKLKPQQVPIDSEIHFGASTRVYVIRERPQQPSQFNDDTDNAEGHLLGLPETETEVDNLTEFNTAHNRRITQMVEMSDPPANMIKKRKRLLVKFGEEEEVINPEDIDPTVGRFRNLVQETFIPNKKPRMAGSGGNDPVEISPTKSHSHLHNSESYRDGHNELATSALSLGTFSVAAKLGLPIPNLAPDVDSAPQPVVEHVPQRLPQMNIDETAPEVPGGPKKKKYAKEAWPGKRPGFLVGPS